MSSISLVRNLCRSRSLSIDVKFQIDLCLFWNSFKNQLGSNVVTLKYCGSVCKVKGHMHEHRNSTLKSIDWWKRSNEIKNQNPRVLRNFSICINQTLNRNNQILTQCRAENVFKDDNLWSISGEKYLKLFSVVCLCHVLIFVISFLYKPTSAFCIITIWNWSEQPLVIRLSNYLNTVPAKPFTIILKKKPVDEKQSQSSHWIYINSL